MSKRRNHDAAFKARVPARLGDRIAGQGRHRALD